MRKWLVFGRRRQGMEMRRQYFRVLAGLSFSAAASAAQWFTVGATDTGTGETLVEIDLDTVRIRSHGGEGVIRVSFDTQRAHRAGFSYRSFVATAQFDCQRRSIDLTSSAYFPQPAGSGPRVGADSSGRDAGMPPELLQSIPAPARQAILKATCTPGQN